MHHKTTASVCTGDVTDGATSVLVSILLKWQTYRSATLQGDRLREVYYTLKDTDDDAKLRQNAGVPTKIRM
jgi:hypothetical protein